MATLERRLDRVLAVRVGGRRRWLHVEWQWEWEKAIAYRVYEYQALLAMAQRDPRNGLRRAPIESTVVLLSGRDAPWPARGRYRVSPRGERFAGACFRIDPVYQCTVAELVEVVTGMSAVAESEPAKKHIKEWLMSIVDEGLIERSWPFKKGEARGEARGIAPVVHLFERKLGRALGDAEKELLRGRLHAVGPERLGDAVMDLDATALGAWLADASAT